MTFETFLNKDITVYTVYGSNYRGVLKVIGDVVLVFDVEYDTFFIEANRIYAVTEHGDSKAAVLSPT